MASIFRTPIIAPRRDIATEYPSSLRTTLSIGSVAVLLLAATPPATVHASTDLSPLSAPISIDLRTSITPSLALLTAPPPVQYVQSTPSYAPRFELPYTSDLRTWITPSALTTAFFIVAPPPPLSSTDTPSAGAAYPSDLRTYAPPRALALLVTPPAKPFGSGITENPRAVEYPSALRSSSSAILPLPTTASPTTFEPRVALIAPQCQIAYPADLRTTSVNLLPTTLQPTGQMPFAQYDWQANTQVAYPVSLRTSISYYVEDQNLPTQPPDFQNPRGAAYPLDLRTWASNPMRVLTSIKPFSQNDWPLPRGTEYPSANRSTLLTPVLTTTVVPAAAPIGNLTNEPTRGAVYPIDARTSTDNRLASTLAPPPAASPFAQHDWQTPRGVLYPIDLRTHTHALDLRLKDTFFGGPGQPPQLREWLLERKVEYPGSLRTLTVNLLLTTLSIPFNPDWAVNSNRTVGLLIEPE